jgi:hypothetical protein
MGRDLSLLSHCKPCGSRCCVEKTGGPRFILREKTLIENRFGKERLINRGGYWVPKKPDGICTFVDRGLCILEEKKPIDCSIFPLDPIYNDDKAIDFVIDTNCPAAEHLSAQFIADAIRLGMGWIIQTDVPAFHDYWSRYKKGNGDQRLVRLSEFLRSKPEGFVEEIASKLPPVHLISCILKG